MNKKKQRKKWNENRKNKNKKAITVILMIFLVMSSVFVSCAKNENTSEADLSDINETLCEETVYSKNDNLPEVHASETSEALIEENNDPEMPEGLLAVMEKASGNQMESWLYVDMDHDGSDELIGVCPDDYGRYQTWYCSSDGKICSLVHQNSVSRDGCKLEPLDLGDRTHVAIDAYNMFGTGKDYSIIALNNGTVSCVVSDNYGYVYMNDEGDILLDVESYDGMYDPDLECTIMHTWNDTYLFFDGNEYKEYGATEISSDEFFSYNNAQELYDLSKAELWQEDTVSIEYTYYRRSNGIIHIQCDVYNSAGYILYGYYTVRYTDKNLSNELGTYTNGQMYPYFSNLEVVYSGGQ